MGRGINLGNTFDMTGMQNRSKSSIGRMIHLFWKKGFRNVRIPVTWGDSFNESSLLTQGVTEAVKYALDKGFYVVLNTHHERWLKDAYNNTPYYNDRFAALWRGIATHFANASCRLVFEILNEPDGALGSFASPDAPSPFNETQINLTRAVNLVGYEAVRSVSNTRIVFVAPNGQGSNALISTIYPNASYLPGAGSDPYLGVTVHSYDPWDFCGQDSRNSHFKSLFAMKSSLTERFNTFSDWYYATGVPTHWGEYGLGRRPQNNSDRDTDMVREYYKFVTNSLALHGWASSVWDDQGWFAITNDYSYVYGLADAVLSTY
ncbi:unnamed protein product [Polarella glacialis]|uniref:Glycoside hydrolase family 5 domain-containing protein n=1 Tax=Polarella glacialis TaxID=89957 RepID=A0A813JL32_POLGL|nr:unnamed protein product [Polarella glacialis]CAE8657862.1 unnamed protein product [Polarella glacialis]CAE8679774.1 unnamed protein product [Polarella glacialis]